MSRITLLIFTLGLLGLPLSSSADPQVIHTYTEGLPLPWPFPLADGCIIDWSSVNGRYSLDHSDLAHQVEINLISDETGQLYKLRMSRFDAKGVLLNSGSTYFKAVWNSVDVFLQPHQLGVEGIWARIQFFHSDLSNQDCSMNHLTAILSLRHDLYAKDPDVTYRLVPLSTNN